MAFARVFFRERGLVTPPVDEGEVESGATSSLPPPPPALDDSGVDLAVGERDPPRSVWSGVRDEFVPESPEEVVSPSVCSDASLLDDLNGLSRENGTSGSHLSDVLSAPEEGEMQLLLRSVRGYMDTLGKDLRKLPSQRDLLTLLCSKLSEERISMYRSTSTSDWLSWDGELREIGRQASALGIPLVWALIHYELLNVM